MESGMMQLPTKESKNDSYEMLFCDTFKGSTPNSKRTQEIKENCERDLSSRRKRKIAKRTSNKKNRLDHISPNQEEMSKAECKKCLLDRRSLYFSGTQSREVPLVNLQKCKVLSATMDLEVIDRTDGLYVKGVCTLVPRSKVQAYLRQNGASVNDNSRAIYGALEAVEALKTAHNPRGASTGPIMETLSKYVTLGASANRAKRGLSVNLRGLNKDKEAYAGLSRLWRMVEHVSQQYIESDDLRALGMIKQQSLFPSFPLISSNETGRGSNMWPSIAVGKNVFLPVHKDRDYFLSVVTPVSNDGANNVEILNYFCFPEVGLAVPLRCLDLLIFNPTVSHCISSRADTQKDVFNTSFYLKTAIVGGNDNSVGKH